MPKIDDLDRLKEIVNAFGDEPAIRQEKGESIEELTPPEQGLSQDLSDLLGLPAEEQESSDTPEPPPEDSFDLDSFSLDDFTSESESGSGDSAPDFNALTGNSGDQPFEEVSSTEEKSLDSFDLDGLLPDSEQDSASKTADESPSLDNSELEALLGDTAAAMPREDSAEMASMDESTTLDSSELEALLGDTAAAMPREESAEMPSMDESPMFDSSELDGLLEDTLSTEEPGLDDSQAPPYTELSAGEDADDLLGHGFDETDTASMDTLSDFDLPEITEMTYLDTGIPGETADTFYEMPSMEDTLAELAGNASPADKEERGFDDFELPDNMEFQLPDEESGSAGFEQELSAEAVPSDQLGESVDMDSFDLPDFGEMEDTTGTESEDLFTGQAGQDFETDGEAESIEISDIEGFEMPDITGMEAGTFEPSQAAVDLPEESFSGLESEGELSFEMPDVSDSFDSAADETGSAGDEQLDQFSIDEFSLPEMDGDFDFSQPEVSDAPGTDTPDTFAAKQSLPVFEELSEAEDSLEFSQSQFDRIKETLASLPLNLKMLVEELIAEQEIMGTQLKGLLDALIRGDSPKEIARIVSGITGKRIVLPKSFEKRTGIAFQQEQESFAYFFKTIGWKIALGVAAAVVILLIIVFGVNEYIVKPLSAMAIYDQGYQALEDGKVILANDKFNEARRIWDSKEQYYRFAEGFITKKELFHAQKMYNTLLERYPGDVKGIIDYAKVETLQKNFSHAEQLLVTGKYENNILFYEGLLMNDKEMNNLDANIAAADNYLAWAEKDFSKSKDAEQLYYSIAETFKDRPEAYLKRADYLMKIEKIAHEKGMKDFDNLNAVLAYRNYFKSKNYNVADAGVYTRLAEYLIDKNELDDVVDILNKSKELVDSDPLTYFEYARFFYKSGEQSEELKFLEAAAERFENKKDADKNKNAFLLAYERKYDLERTAKQILTYNRLGEFYLYNSNDSRPEIAQQKLIQAQELYKLSARDLIRTKYSKSGEFGRIFYNLGNISFSAGNYTKALGFFQEAETNNYFDPDQKYKMGYIKYSRNDLDDALIDFHKVLQDLPENKAALFALATTEYERNQYPIAHGYYLHLLKILEQEKNEIPGSPQVNENPSHRNLIFNIFVVENNLGCTYFKQSVNKGEEYIIKSLVMLSRAAELFDIVSRDVETMKRLEETTITRVSGRLETVKIDNKDNAYYLVAPRHVRNQDVVTHGKDTDRRNPVDVEIYPSLPYTIHSSQLLPTEFYPLETVK